MITLHPSILTHEGKKTFAVLPCEEANRDIELAPLLFRALPHIP